MEQLKEDDLAVLRGGRGDATSVCTPAINKDYPPAKYRGVCIPPLPSPYLPPRPCRRIGGVSESSGGDV